MENLIKALQIFLKYDNAQFPTHCEHDVLQVMGDYSGMTDEDKAILDELHFSYYEDDECFKSYFYGSA